MIEGNKNTPPPMAENASPSANQPIKIITILLMMEVQQSRTPSTPQYCHISASNQGPSRNEDIYPQIILDAPEACADLRTKALKEW
ncbi:MAG: hypothetical protein HUJ27_00885 [Rhodobacteraceae bacterium]|nr:hypothetical protein [Paracoccaceae bacterium]